jgi:hypothetical protein
MYLPSEAKCDLATLRAMYGDADVAADILASAVQNATVALIESGNSTLPERSDAVLFSRTKRLRQLYGDNALTNKLIADPEFHEIILKLNARLDALEKKGGK